MLDLCAWCCGILGLLCSTCYTQIAQGEERTRRVRLIYLAPLLVQQLADTALLGCDLLEVIKAVPDQIYEILDISLPLDPPVDHARA